MDVDVAPVLQACASCKKNKRRCNKEFPTCGWCLKTGRTCDYSNPQQSVPGNEIIELRRRVQELEEHVRQFPSQMVPSASVASEPIDTTLSVQAFYLDSPIWPSIKVSGRPAPLLAPIEISAALGDQAGIDSIKKGYFHTIHGWLPFISRIRVERLTGVPRDSLKADVALLLLCMKLVQQVPERPAPQSLALYRLAKEFSKRLEFENMFTLSTTQANVLLLLFEVGHGIYPAAFMSVSYCARQGVALGLHNKLAPQLLGKPRSWIDWEERQRVWWTIVIMDRYVGLGSNHRPLCTDDPDSDTLLPADDGAWDRGDMVPPERVSLASRTSSNAISPFAHLAQASNLLGRVIRHCNEMSMEANFMIDDFETLCQANYSLLELLKNHEPWVKLDASIAKLICFSALFKLSDRYLCNLFYEEVKYDAQTAPRLRVCFERSLNIVNDICGQITILIPELRELLSRETVTTVSPLVLDCVYTCAQNMHYMMSQTNNNPQVASAKAVCGDLLQLLDARWKLAGIYLELLKQGDEGQVE